MELILQRELEINNSVIGKLSINGKFLCYTLEDKIRDVKIKHETCIPEGEYRVIMNMSTRFKTVLPLLLNVPNFEGIRIHAGNTIEDTSGCILVGVSVSGETLLHSKVALVKVLEYLVPALKKEEVTIKVLNPVKLLPVIPKPVEVLEKTDTITISGPLNISSGPLNTIENKQSFFKQLNQFIQWLVKIFYKS